MKKSLLLAAAVLALCFAACQKEEKDGTHFIACMEQASPDKTVLDTSSNLLTWTSSDQVKIFAYSGSMLCNTVSWAAPRADDPTWADFYAITLLGRGPYMALYPASIASNYNNVLKLDLPAEQASVAGELTGFPMYAYSDTVILQFKNLCGVLRVHLEQDDVAISRIELTASNGSLSGEFELGGIDDAPTLAAAANGTVSSTVALTCSTPQNIGGSGHDFFIYLPVSPAAGYDLTLKMYQPDGSCCTKSASGVVVERNTIYRVKIGGSYEFVTPLPEGSLNGLFSVSDTTQVRFSQGNLQWTSTGSHAVNGGTMSGTWRFAEHQYDVVGSPSLYTGTDSYFNYPGNVSGSDNANISSSYTGWIDLFGWGTSGYCNSSDTYNTYYNPYCTSTAYDGSSYNQTGYGPSTNMADPSLTGTSANYDWGVYNAISNGGNAPNQWRTLTRSEWYYLRFTRTDATSKYATGQIQMDDGAYVNGCIFLPDSWTLPTGCSFTAGGSSSSLTDYSLNTYTLSQWAQMEAAGALFLPAAGERYGMNPRYVGGYGRYWSSSFDDRYSAYYLDFSGYIVTAAIHPRYYGQSVRLVQDN